METMAAGVSIRISLLLQIFAFSVLLLATEGNRDVHYPYSLHSEDLIPNIDVQIQDVNHSPVRVRRDVPTDVTTTTTAQGQGGQDSVTSEGTTTTTTTTTTSPPSTPAPKPATFPPESSTTLTPAPKPATNPPSRTTTAGQNFTEVEDDHKYYGSFVVTGSEAADHWVTFEQLKTWASQKHKTLSDSHRTAATIKLSFKFLFYGHEVEKVTIATGGFLYMSDFLHQWLTATQYVAPLMANFDTKLGNNSNIHYADNGTAFIVWWERVHLQDNSQVGPFSFQAILMQDGRIIFNYKEVPVKVGKISTARHPVKIGVSDAYYVDSVIQGFNVRRRTIYEYHRVEINVSAITNYSSVLINPKQTCIAISDCQTCLNAQIGFNCEYCSSTSRCSDGLDRHRQEWLQKGCHQQSIAQVTECPKPSATTTASTTTTTSASRSSASRSSAVTGLPIHKTTPCVSSSCLTASVLPTKATDKAFNTSPTTTLNTENRLSTTSLVATTNAKTSLVPSTNPSTSASTTETLPSKKTTIVHSSGSTSTSYTTQSTKISVSSISSTTLHTTLPSTTSPVISSKTISSPTTLVRSKSLFSSTSTSPSSSTFSSGRLSFPTSSTPSHGTTTRKTTNRPPASRTRRPLATLKVYVCLNGKPAQDPKECPAPGGDSSKVIAPDAGKGGGGFPVGAIVAVIVVIIVIVLITAWFVYAYMNPNTKSGMWLIEHRPSNLRARLSQVKFWKQSEGSGEKYEVSVQPDGGESVA